MKIGVVMVGHIWEALLFRQHAASIYSFVRYVCLKMIGKILSLISFKWYITPIIKVKYHVHGAHNMLSYRGGGSGG